MSSRVITAIPDHILITRTPPPWLLEGYAPVNGIMLVHGKSGAGKSYICLDIAMCIATGKSWHGHKVKQGPVIYMSAEGQDGLSSRMRAWRQKYEMGTGPLPMFHVLEIVDPLDKEAMWALGNLIAEIKPIAVFSDTWAAHMGGGGGDVNAPKDTGQAATAWRKLINVYHFSAWMLHHQGHKESARALGSGALKNAAENEMSIDQDKAGILTVANLKRRDKGGADSEQFILEVIDLGIDANGDKDEACVPVLATEPHPASDPESTTDQSQKTLRELELTIQANATMSGKEPVGLTFTAWSRCVSQSRGTFDRTVQALLAAGQVKKQGVGRGAKYVPAVPATDETIWKGPEECPT